MIAREEGRCRLVVTADDFGISEQVNRAIVLAFEHGLISNTSIMPNMSAFADACALVDRCGLHGRVGVHLNLSEGWPLTQGIRAQSRFCGPSGTFIGRHRVLRLSRLECESVERELEAQIVACKDRGIHPTHLDSHHHFHSEWPIGAIVVRLAARHGVPEVRLTRNCGEELGGLRRLYKFAYNNRLRRASLSKVAYFGTADHVLSIASRTVGRCEINVHPTFGSDGALVDRLTGEKLEALADRLRTVAAIESMGSSPAENTADRMGEWCIADTTGDRSVR